MSKLAEVNYNDYLRVHRLPTTWCAGCGDGAIMKALIRAMDDLKVDRDNTAIISGIGCSGRFSGYLDFNTLHVTHGRTLAFATGMKMANPDANIIVISGDGDSLAIGGNHFIHACRRNIDITLIIINNYTYGLTGGQVSPSTPLDSSSPTAPYGSIEPTFDTCKLAQASGASFVSRTVVASPLHMDKMMKAALSHKGFSLVEVMSNCHINWGRKNEYAAAADLIKHLKDSSTFSAEEAEAQGKHLLGILHNTPDKKEYVTTYYEMAQAVQARDAMKKGVA
jgi:2-oxoglutarate/2-oxoacid ferredoxin oxidoreductase subunit beta